MNILLIEDDPLLSTLLASALKQSDYKITHAADGSFANGVLRAYEMDLVILDLGLPDMDGIDILRGMRNQRIRTPVLVLTARDGVDQQVAALDAGADDYMEKPFDLRELEARVRALLRRSLTDTSQQIEFGSLVVNPFDSEATLNGERLELPSREYEMLEALALNAPRVVSKARLAQRLSLDSEDIGDNAVEVYIHRLRKRMLGKGITIRTVRGVGYILEEAE